MTKGNLSLDMNVFIMCKQIKLQSTDHSEPTDKGTLPWKGEIKTTL